MDHLNNEQKLALAFASDLLKTPEEEIMDPQDCGGQDCMGCETRHATARMVVEDPARLRRILTEQQVKFDAFNARLADLEKRRDAIYEEKEQLDGEVEKAYEALAEELRKPAALLN